jgi:hypothetical protein
MKFAIIAQNLLKFSKEIDRFTEPPVPFLDHQYFQVDYQKKIALKREGYKYLDKACHLFLNKVKNGKKLSEIVSIDYIRNQLIEITVNALVNHKEKKDVEIINEITHFFKDIKSFEREYFVGLGNFIVKNDYHFGLLRIIPNKKESIEKNFSQEWKERGESNQIFNLLGEEGKEKILSIAIISCSTVDDKKGAEISLSIIRQHLNILQCFSPEGIFIEGAPTRDWYQYIVYDINEDRCRMAMGNKRGGNYYNPFDFDVFVEKHGELYKKLDSALKSDSPHCLERKIIFSLDWLGDSRFEDNTHHRLVKLMIALESLLLDNHDVAKRILLEERAAFLFSKEYEKRIQIKEIIGESYRIRNEVVHTGNKKNVSLELLENVSFLIQILNLEIILSDKYETFTDIIKYVEKEKYGFSKSVSS